MINEFSNRQNMHLTVGTLLADPAHQPVWKGKAPVIFSTRAAALGPMVTSLTDLIAAQQAATTGFAADKAREEEELETIAHEISEALADWFEDQGKQAEATAMAIQQPPYHSEQAIRFCITPYSVP